MALCTTVTAKFVHDVFIGCFSLKEREFWQLVYEDSFSFVTQEIKNCGIIVMVMTPLIRHHG